MKTPRHATSTRRSKKIVTTLGELIAAAYGAADGDSQQRQERAAMLLTESSLARGFSRRLLFVR
jgi:hypothetical protein